MITEELILSLGILVALGICLVLRTLNSAKKQVWQHEFVEANFRSGCRS